MADFKRIIQRTTNSERIETGVADLQPNEICIVEDTEDMVYKDKNGKFIFVTKDRYIINSIEDLKTSKKYKSGDIVQVLGMYTPGDGYHSYKSISSKNFGNGIMLENGLWANEINFGNNKFVSDRTKEFWKSFYKNKDISFTAHRGYWRFAPENSIKAIRTAYDLGFNMVELDVRLTEDMVPILMHDSTVDRTTNGSGNIREITFDVLRTFTLKNDPNGDFMQVPTFEEAILECKKYGITINIDSYFSYEFGSDPIAFQIVYDIIKKHNYLDKVFFMVNDHDVRLALKSIDPYICCGFLGNPNNYIKECESIIKYFPNCLIGFNWDVDESVIKYYLDKNIPVYLYNAENYLHFEECIKKGARFIETNTIIPREVTI